MDDEIMPTEEPKKRCVMCERASGIFGLLLGSIILFIAIDTLTGGKIAAMISGRVEANDES